MSVRAVDTVIPVAQLATNFTMTGMNPEGSFYPGREIVAENDGLFREVDPRFREIFVNQVVSRVPTTMYGLQHLMENVTRQEAILVLRELGMAVSPYHFYHVLRHTPEVLLPMLTPGKRILTRISSNTVHETFTEVVFNRHTGHLLRMPIDQDEVHLKDAFLLVSLGGV
jgi:hypothetical protein